MSKDAQQLVIAGNGTVNIAPFGTPLPTDIDSVLHTDFDDFGYTTDDGVKFSDAKTITDISAWQSFYPIRKIISARDASLEFTLQEWDRRTISLAFGGGTWSEPAPGNFNYTPPDPEDIDHRSVVIDLDDGTNAWRILMPKATLVSNTESSFHRTGAALLPITMGVVGVDGVAPWKLMTDSNAASIAGQGS